MKSIINREAIKARREDPNIDVGDFEKALCVFLDAKTKYKSAKKAYNTIKKSKMMRMNVDAFKKLIYLYEQLREARNEYTTAKRDLNLIAIDTFTDSVTVKLEKKDLGDLVTKLVDLYGGCKDPNQIVELTFHTDKNGKVL
jgi:hypothetical protein